MRDRETDTKREVQGGRARVRVLLPVPTPPPGPSPSPQYPQPPSLLPTPLPPFTFPFASYRFWNPLPLEPGLEPGVLENLGWAEHPLPNEHSFSPGLQRSKVAALFTHSRAFPELLLSSFFIMETAQWPQAPWETTPHSLLPRLQTQTLVSLQ